jgi:hypothetical protein
MHRHWQQLLHFDQSAGMAQEACQTSAGKVVLMYACSCKHDALNATMCSLPLPAELIDN